jgi:hypothetical protein
MITNPILEDKSRVQRELSQQADHDPGGYIALAHRKVLETQKRYGIQFRYVEDPVSYKEPA